MARLYGRAGRVTAQTGGFRPGAVEPKKAGAKLKEVRGLARIIISSL
jgi:hypothetical protein